MHFISPLNKGILVKRYKRFLADVYDDKEQLLATHCTNTGSMKGVLAPPQKAYVSKSANPNRKLPYTLEILECEGQLIGVNTHRTNKLAHEFLSSGTSPFGELANIKAEHKISPVSRADFWVQNSSKQDIIIEVKNVSLKEGSNARFPDSPTTRGQKHLEELMEIVNKGGRAAMLYICQRNDVDSFSPADEIDSRYGELLRKAQKCGVEIYAYSCVVTPEEISVNKPLDIIL